MNYLHDDIVKQILVKVQCCKSILRCTSVCKPWYSLIKSPAFIDLHLHCPDEPKYLLCDYYTPRRYLSIHHDTETLVEHGTLVSSSNSKRESMEIRGCCNGLIFYTLDGHAYLWNPIIGKQKDLPSRPGADLYGFWFDKRVNDYIVAKLFRECCDVYSLSTNSWRNITAEVPIDYFGVIAGELAYVDGILHWTVLRRSGWMICSLNIESGMLRKTMITESWDTVIFSQPLGEHSFAVFESSPYGRNLCSKVHVYDQNVNNLYTIDMEKETHHELDGMAGLRNNGEALFTKLDRNDTGIISWNTKTKDIKEFVPEVTVTEAHDGSYHHANYRLSHATPFVETLVLLNDGYNTDRISTPNHHSTYQSKVFCILLLIFIMAMLIDTIYQIVLQII